MDARFSFETKVLAAFAAAVLVVAALAATTWKMSRDALEASLQLSHAQEVLNNLAQARGTTLLIESITRGYVISGDAGPLAERDAVTSARETSLRRIMELTADNARQQERWTRLREVVDERIALSKRSVLLRETEGFEAARAHSASAPVRETRERYLQVLREMEEEERRLLEERSAEQLRAQEITVATGALAALALVVLLIATYFLIRRQMRATEASRRALEVVNARIGAILDTVADGIITIDERGIVETLNPAAERIFCYAAAEVIGRNVKMLMPEPYHSEHDSYLERYRATGDARVIGIGREVMGRRKDGSTFALELAVSEMRLDGERHFTGIVRDITERKQAEDQLSRFFTLSLDMLCISSADGYFKRVSPAFTTTLGWSTEEILARPFLDFVHPDDHAATLREVERQVSAGENVLHFENRYLHKDGSWRVLSWKSVPHAAGLMFATARDITEQKRIEETLRAQSEEIARKNVELEEANRAKSDFLANMSHELRTPLNSIIGFSEMLRDGILGKLDTKQRGFVTDIFDAGTHLLSLINDILDLSKVEAGMLQLEPGAVDVPALLKASTLVVREKALAHRIRLDTQLDPALGTMHADERKLKQIVYNLLSNAVKFTPEGGVVTLRARRCARAEVALDQALPGRLIALPPGEDGEFLAIVVEDTGVGIVEEHLAKLFQPFMQVDRSIARRQGGTGLGLSLVRRLAELHGGTVGVASRPEAGSRFCVWLPYREAAPAAHEGGTVPAGAAPSAPAVPLALVIEDDDRIADLIAAQLRAEGFEVMRAATGEEGLVRAAKRKPQLITLDIFLPAMDGWEFMRRLKANPKLADVPVVIITVSKDLDRGLALGARRVLQKPFVRAELMAALAGLVDARSGGERARVLVVDDNVKAVEIMATALEAEGYLVMRAYGGAEAIEVARSARPELVILDLMMPEVSGFEVARALRESEHTARIPILVLTAKDLTAEDHAHLNGEVSAILAKASFSTNGLLAELRRALPKRAED